MQPKHYWQPVAPGWWTKFSWLVLVLGLAGFMPARGDDAGAAPPWGHWPQWGDQGNGRYGNPVLPADYSDLDCIRVGADYYAISSTLQYSPGMVILHSKDLVNWSILGHVVADLTQIGPNLNWDHLNRYGRGVWAGAIRYHDGRFWVYFGTPDEGYFMSTARDAAGPWEPLHGVLNEAGWDDCCPFWDDDGQGYLVGTNFKDGYKTWLFKLAADGRELVSDSRVLLNEGAGREANKLYKINGTYYHLFSEHHGAGRYVMMQRASQITGPYVEKQQLSQIQPEAHEPNQGGLVQTEQGDWFFFTHHGIGDWEGRCASLLPVTWVGGWPILGQVGEDGLGKMVWSGRKPVADGPVVVPQTDDTFDGPQLGVQWEWNHQPRADQWSLTERPGFLRLHAFKPLRPDDLKAAGNTLTQRALRTVDNRVALVLEVGGMAEGQVAGLCHYSRDYSTLGVRCQDGVIRLESASNQTITQGPVLRTPRIWLRSAWGAEGKSHYDYSTNGTDFVPLGATYQLGWGNYRGDRIGIFTYNNNGEAGYVDCDSFTYRFDSPATREPLTEGSAPAISATTNAANAVSDAATNATNAVSDATNNATNAVSEAATNATNAVSEAATNVVPVAPAKPAVEPNGVLLGSWNTQVEYADLKLVSGGVVVLKDAFEEERPEWHPVSGDWQVVDGTYRQTSSQMPALTRRACRSGGDYQLSVRARQDGGAEGFLVGFGARDDENFYWLNLGGWGNTLYRLQKTMGGNRRPIGPAVAGQIEPGRWYDVQIRVTGHRIQCFLDGAPIIDLTDEGFAGETTGLPADNEKANFGQALIPDLVADPSIVDLDGTFYCYATTDGWGEGLDSSGTPVVWQSKDFLNWSFEGSSFPADFDLKYWAPSSLVHRNGRYYSFPTLDGEIAVVVAETPVGPFVAPDGQHVTRANHQVFPIDPNTIDAEVFVDDDNQAYMVWQMRHLVKLTPDLLSPDGATITLPTKREGYSEGPYLTKRKGIYYYFYTLGGDEAYQYAYMMSHTSPLGPWEAPPQDIIATTDSAEKVFGPGHGCFFHPQGSEQWYFVYLEYGRGGTTRQIYADRMNFNEDGTIQPIKLTKAGVGALRPVADPAPNLALGASATASSTQANYRVRPRRNSSLDRVETYVPSNAVDGANGSRWLAAPGDSAAWFQVDLGAAREIHRTEAYFVKPAAGHAYRLEWSLDGATWQPYGGHDELIRRSPHRDEKTVQARYLKLTILQGEPGLWEFRVY
jgi:beta-xylosidase